VPQGAPARPQAPDKGNFSPGLDAPRSPAASNTPAGKAPASANAAAARPATAGPAADARQLFTLQALSTYAAMIVGEDAPAANGVAEREGAKRTARLPAAPPPPPGSMLDLKA